MASMQTVDDLIADLQRLTPEQRRRPISLRIEEGTAEGIGINVGAAVTLVASAEAGNCDYCGCEEPDDGETE